MNSYDEPLRGGRRKAARPRELGRALKLSLLALVAPAVPLLLVGAWLYFLGGWRNPYVTSLVVRPGALQVITVAIIVCGLIWVTLIAATYSGTRPDPGSPLTRTIGAVVVALLCGVVAVPTALGVRYTAAHRDFIETVFKDEVTATAPRASTGNPWGDRNRVNVLLLGGDGAVGRPGVRTDTVMLASISVKTGSTILFALPRNLQRVPFPEGTPLAEEYPDGFTGSQGLSNYLLNAVYGNIPAWYPGINGPSDNEGADAIKQAVSGALGISVDYYVLVNLDGFESIVDAIGGITVNINNRVPIGGDTSRGREPDYWMEPGPDQRLDGFHALWFARGRYGSSDYQRMARQRCALNAIVREARPLTLFRRYTALAEAGKKLIRTDIPQELLPAFVELGAKVKGGRLKSVGFELSDDFNPNDPDYEYVQRRVSKVITRQEKRDRGERVPRFAVDEESEASDTEEDCEYQLPEDEYGVPVAADELPRGVGDPVIAP